MQREMIGIFAGGDAGQQAWSGQALVDDLDRCRCCFDAIMTLLARILETDMLADEQTGRLIIELLVNVLAKLRTGLATARTETLSLGERVFATAPRQVVGQFLATMAAFAFGPIGVFGLVVRGGAVRRDGLLGRRRHLGK